MINTVKPIRSEEEYQEALVALREVFSAAKGTPEYDLAEVLEILIEAYESRHYPIEDADPIETIKYLMEENDMNQTEIGKILGDKSKASLILNRKRKLSLTMIRSLHQKMKIPLEILVKDYALTSI